MSLPAGTRNFLYCLTFSLLFGAGCSTVAPTAPAQGGFNLRGKLGVVEDDDSFSARFLWQQRERRFTIDLWGPLGQGRLRLTGSGRRLELRRGDGSLIARGPADAVMERQLGWSIPLSVLPQWVRGQPARGIPVSDEVHDSAGRLTAFRQLDWRVVLEGYHAVAPGPGNTTSGLDRDVYLPDRVTATRDAYRVRLAISDWQL